MVRKGVNFRFEGGLYLQLWQLHLRMDQTSPENIRKLQRFNTNQHIAFLDLDGQNSLHHDAFTNDLISIIHNSLVLKKIKLITKQNKQKKSIKSESKRNNKMN